MDKRKWVGLCVMIIFVLASMTVRAEEKPGLLQVRGQVPENLVLGTDGTYKSKDFMVAVAVNGDINIYGGADYQYLALWRFHWGTNAKTYYNAWLENLSRTVDQAAGKVTVQGEMDLGGDFRGTYREETSIKDNGVEVAVALLGPDGKPAASGIQWGFAWTNLKGDDYAGAQWKSSSNSGVIPKETWAKPGTSVSLDSEKVPGEISIWLPSTGVGFTMKAVEGSSIDLGDYRSGGDPHLRLNVNPPRGEWVTRQIFLPAPLYQE